VDRARRYDERARAGGKPTPAQTRLGRQMEKDERFWLAAALMQPGPAGDSISKSRLYGWLMPAYQDPASPLLRQHLPHRDHHDLAQAANRLGWASWEDCQTVSPGACRWLTTAPNPPEGAITTAPA
jgi:hypothetical protein